MRIAEKLTDLVAGVLMMTFLAQGCAQDSPPEGVVPMETFAEIYASLVENERLAGPAILLNTKQYDADTTLARFGVTRDQIQRTIEYYNEDVRRWHAFYVEAMQRIEWGAGKKNLDKAREKKSKPAE
jgi:hypothetical protein